MRYPRRRRPVRVAQWTGWVLETGPDTIWVRLAPVHRRGVPEIDAEVGRDRLPEARDGMYINLYVHHKGQKRRSVLREKPLPARSAEEIAEIHTKAARWVEEMAPYWLDDHQGATCPAPTSTAPSGSNTATPTSAPAAAKSTTTGTAPVTSTSTSTAPSQPGPAATSSTTAADTSTAARSATPQVNAGPVTGHSGPRGELTLGGS